MNLQYRGLSTTYTIRTDRIAYTQQYSYRVPLDSPCHVFGAYGHMAQENESLLFEKGLAQERINELTAVCERQRSSLAESGRRAKELERISSAAKQEAKLADKQVGPIPLA